ncbi:MAG: DNA internalization-related competence protein ComEC/Rec2 [Candidatus Caldatribacteriota bacterium]|nr:DNA internalization-related competence protein ComEC/Rec2 [Candidatus Caldatribacteriota bacterium]
MLFFYILGILLGSYLKFNLLTIFFIILVLVLLTIIGYIKQWNFTTALFFVILVLIGIFNYNLNSRPLGNNNIANYISEKKVNIVGTVLDKKCYPDNDKISLKIKANYIFKDSQNIKTNGLVLLNIYTGNYSYEYGDVLKIKGRLQKPLEPKNFGDFNYESYLAQKKIFSCLNVWMNKDVEIIGKEKINILIKSSLFSRDKIKEVLSKTLPHPYNYLLIAMMLGEKSFVPQEVKETFINAGVMHILAVSGLHVGIIAGFLFIFLGLLKIPKKVKYITIILLLASYVPITGFRPSVVRAFIMFSLLIIGRLINRSRNLYFSLFFAAFLILLLNPLTIYDSGFLLSFIVTFFIIYLTPILSLILSNLTGWLRNPLSVSIAAWIGIFPLSAYFFNKVSLISIISNIVIIPLAGIAIVLGFITFFIGILNIQIASMVAFLNYWALGLIVFVAKLLSSLPFSFIYTAQPSVLNIILYYLFIFIIIEIFYKQKFSLKVKTRTAITVLVIILFVVGLNLFLPGNELKVHYINVGEGDCILIEAPKNINILIDGGGTPQNDFDVGEKILIPYLRRIGINEIDLLILTHPHLDHLEGLLPVVRELKINMVLDNKIICDISEYNEFISIIKNKKIPYHDTVEGDSLTINKNLEILILNPSYRRKNICDEDDLNNNSIVVKLFYKNSNFLFTGDIEKEAEKRMLIWNEVLNSDVLKVGHHGSSTSTDPEFLNKVDPIIAVITTGKNNFGHPSQDVINRLKNRDIKVFRTDKNGTIIIETDGDRYLTKTLREKQ